MRHGVKVLRFAVGSFLAAGVVGLGCGSAATGTASVYGTPDAGAGDGSYQDVTLGGETGKLENGAQCVQSTCASLNANCGAVTDPKCGGVVQCGSTCPTGTVCGGGGVHNKCGSGGGGNDPDACVKQTCASQSITCGQAGDGCGGTISCGGCSSPQSCGGDPTKQGQCGCTGVCAEIPVCTGTGGPDGGPATTTLSGKVYDPAGTYGLYNALVYIPNNPSDPGLAPFPAGITCDVCGSTAAGDPLVSTLTGTDGSFTLTGVPVGTSIPLVIQLGRWRRQFTFPIATPCASNSIPDQTLKMPSTHMQGDMPRVAIVTGAYDPVECVLLKIGIDPSEFTDPGGSGYIQFYTANDPSATAAGTGAGAKIDTATPSQDALFAATGGPGGTPEINNYDMTILECEAYPEVQSAAQQAALATYAGSGGRVFASDYQYAWLYENPALMGAANWHANQDGNGAVEIGIIDQPPANPTGTAFASWLGNVGFSSASSDYVLINPAFHNTDSVVPPTQPWLHAQAEGGAVTTPIHFTFNTPIGAESANQCGRVTFSDWHAQGNNLRSGGTIFPSACPAGPLTPQEAILEFMLFDLSACVQPYTPICTPRTCAQADIGCGPASDGCGNLIQCGSCPSGQSCGGGGPGKCGATTNCTAETCSGQSIQCGPAGDGCGNEIQCGNCATGDICGLNGPGHCGAPAK